MEYLKNKKFINKDIVQELKDYEYRYAAQTEKPILIVGPAGDDTHLRVYAYGGGIGEIATNPKTQCKLAFSKDDNGKYSYGKYLKDGYENGHNHVFNYESVPGLKDLKEKLGGELEEKFAELAAELAGNCTKEQKKDMIKSERYLELIISAAYTRFMHREKGRIKGLSERSKQTLIAKQCQKAEWNKEEKNFIVVDIEYDIPLNNEAGEPRTQWNSEKTKKVVKKNAKVDFVVFDGTSFGLIEFKYQGYSMEAGSNNSLKEHYLDFQRIICEDTNENKIKVIKKLIERTAYLSEYEIIDESWIKPLEEMEMKIKNMKPEEYDSDMLWCGFYFVGSGKKDIKTEIKKQIPVEAQNGNKMTVRFQFDEDEKTNIISYEKMHRDSLQI